MPTTQTEDTMNVLPSYTMQHVDKIYKSNARGQDNPTDGRHLKTGGITAYRDSHRVLYFCVVHVFVDLITDPITPIV